MSAVNSTGQGLFQFLQQISNSPTAAASQPTVAADATGTQSAPAAQGASGHHHHHHGGGGDFAKIESAVTTALQSAQGDSDADPNQIIQDAISKALQASPATGTGATDGSSATTSAAGPADADGSRQAFFQTLQSFGVSADQFHADLLAAVKNAQSTGNADPSSAFASFPNGTAVDTTG